MAKYSQGGSPKKRRSLKITVSGPSAQDPGRRGGTGSNFVTTLNRHRTLARLRKDVATKYKPWTDLADDERLQLYAELREQRLLVTEIEDVLSVPRRTVWRWARARKLDTGRADVLSDFELEK